MQHIQEQIEEIKLELKEQPGDAELMNELGVGYYLLGEYDRSAEVLDEAACLAPEHHIIQFNLGSTYIAQQNVEQAIHHFMNAIDIKADYVPALNNLADIYEQAGETDRAGDLFRYITKINPDDAMGYFNLANFYLRQNNTPEAGKQYKKAIELDPEFYEAYNNIGFILKHLGKYNEAIPYYEQCLAINPQFEAAQKDLEECREKLEVGNEC